MVSIFAPCTTPGLAKGTLKGRVFVDKVRYLQPTENRQTNVDELLRSWISKGTRRRMAAVAYQVSAASPLEKHAQRGQNEGQAL